MEKKPATARKRTTTASGTTPAKAKTTTTRPRAARSAASATAPHAGAPTHEQIAARAHELYVRSGHQHGRETEFWLEAERQLRGEATIKA